MGRLAVRQGSRVRTVIARDARGRSVSLPQPGHHTLTLFLSGCTECSGKLVRTWEKYAAAKRLTFTVVTRISASELRQFDAYRTGYATLLTGEPKVYASFGVFKLPAICLVSPEGELLLRSEAANKIAEVQDEVSRILQGH